MMKKTLGWIATLGMASALYGFGGCSQPRTECQVALASTLYSYVGKFQVKTPPAPGCEGILALGDTFGMEFYHPASADGKTYDQTKTTFAIKPEGEITKREAYANFAYESGWWAMGYDVLNDELFADKMPAESPSADVLAKCPDPMLTINQRAACYCAEPLTPEQAGRCQCMDPEDEYTNTCLPMVDGSDFSTGVFASSDPDEGDFCTVKMDAAPATKLTLNGLLAVPGTDPMSDGTDSPYGPLPELPAYMAATWDWSNIKLYVTAGAPGTQFSGTLKFTADTCSVEYETVGFWPAIPCGSDTDCSPCPPPGAPYGSGINPDFPTACDADIGYCTLRSAKDKKSDAKSIPQILDTPVDCGEIE